MTRHMTGTREEWLAARLGLLEAEKELTQRGDELARRRQQLPWVRVDKAYRFETDEGSASLAELFRGRSQLLVYHFMFGPVVMAYERASQQAFLGVSALRFAASATGTIVWCASMSAMGEMPMAGGWTMSMA